MTLRKISFLALALALLSNFALAEQAVAPDIFPEETNRPTGGITFSSNPPPPAGQAGFANDVQSGESLTWRYPISREILEDELDVIRLVSKEFLLEKDYPPQDWLVDVTVRKGSSSAMKARDVASEALARMFDAAEAEGIRLYLSSAYRSYGTQATMYENRLKNNNGKDDGVVQKPGASDHQTGLGFDIVNKVWVDESRKFNASFAETNEAKWMAENCAQFGFIIRYPLGKEDITGIIYEPWHLRYVGVEAAIYMTQNALTLEEFTLEYQAALSDDIAMVIAPESIWNTDVVVDSFGF